MSSAGDGKKRRRSAKTKAGRQRSETWRLKRLLSTERELWAQGVRFIAGVDEVGRGPLAGPVVAAAVILPPDTPIRGVDDSKRLPPERREALSIEIRKHALAIGVGAASSREVDRMNILRASHLAMQRALGRLCVSPERVIVDGLPIPLLGTQHIAVIDGDAKVHCIACASIIAKVVRDRLMARLAGHYPAYGWQTNCGYATSDHVEAIFSLGLTPHHRRSFEPRSQLGLALFD
jgi:ribonuclease HII